MGRALGTPLEWDEAKKRADLVRKLGIKVRGIPGGGEIREVELTGSSNCWRFGIRTAGMRGMCCCGVMRHVASPGLGCERELD